MATFEHNNVNGLNTQCHYMELEHLVRTLDNTGSGFFSINEHTLDSTNPSVKSKIKEVVKSVDKYAKVSISFNED